MSGLPFFHFLMAAMAVSVSLSWSVAQVAPENGVENDNVGGSSVSEIAPMPRETGFDSSLPSRKITLKESIAIALEQGNGDFKEPALLGSNPNVQDNQPIGGSSAPGLLGRRNQLDVQINYLLANVEVSYWNLFAAYHNLIAQEEGLRQAYITYRSVDTRALVGSDPPQNRDQARAQFERFRRLVIDARGQFQDSERRLRGLLGMRGDDGLRLVPSDEPDAALAMPDFQKAASEALANRPEILSLRLDLQAQQRKLVLLKKDNQDLVLTAELNLKRSNCQLHDTELKVLENLVQQYRQVIQTHSDIASARAEREALQSYLKKINKQIALGKWNAQDFLNYLTVQQQLATASATEYEAIANYKNALATFEFAKGTIQKYNKLSAGE